MSFQVRLLKRVSLVLAMACAAGALARADVPDPARWDEDPSSEASLLLDPERESAKSGDGLTLALKRLPRPGAQPVLLVHGLAQNDRFWDTRVAKYSFARFLHAHGFDVWVGNLRAAGTEGFRSDTPPGPHHWTIDDYAIHDLPALVQAVRERTGQAPFLVAHSLAAWAAEGFLAGAAFGPEGAVIARPGLRDDRQKQLRGVISVAGVHNMRWRHPLAQASDAPLRGEADYYHSNYELELLAGSRPLFHVVHGLGSLPLGWISAGLNLPVRRIPFVGDALERLYFGLQGQVIESPVLNMFYYAPNSDTEMVRLHARDGLEDLGPRLLEQLANAVNDKRTSSYYHLKRPEGAYDYAAVRERVDVPMLFVGAGRDRLATALEVYEDGYLPTRARDKQYLHVERAGHLDICTGRNAPAEVMMPVVRWMRAR